MAIFGSLRDINTFKSITRELVEDVVSQQVGYYKIVLNSSPLNVYGESLKKTFIGPVLINCLIERTDYEVNRLEVGIDTTRKVNFRFFKDHLVDANVVPEIGDVIMYNELYYEVDNVNENQLILGKNPDYSYSQGLENFGSSYAIICIAHFTSPDSLSIQKQRL
jgi:hypothetical protein